MCGCTCQVEELTAENTQLKERVALLEKLLDIKKQDEQLLNKMMEHVNLSQCYNCFNFLLFACTTLASAVLAMERWLDGCLTHASIVSKRLNLSENFFDQLSTVVF